MHHGFLLIDKPAGMTSHDVVNRLRRVTGEKRIGHAGTLDPFATGLLLIGVGREATRCFPQLVGMPKTYEATFVFGATSDTDDLCGVIHPTTPLPLLEEEVVQEAIQEWVGTHDQIPPQYAAIKINGKKLYELARQGIQTEVKPRSITLTTFETQGPLNPHPSLPELPAACWTIPVRIACSSGTYIRALARDVGNRIHTGGYVRALRRTSIGPYKIEDAVRLDTLTSLNWNRGLFTLPEGVAPDRVSA